MDLRPVSAWRRPALVVIAVLGIAISIYLTATHSGSVPLVCTIGSIVNCASVTRSAYSVIPGTTIAISVLGIVWFAVSGALALFTSPVSWVSHLIWAAIGLLVVLYLVFIEIVVLHQICEWCSVVHLLVIATFILALGRLQEARAA